MNAFMMLKFVTFLMSPAPKGFNKDRLFYSELGWKGLLEKNDPGKLNEILRTFRNKTTKIINFAESPPFLLTTAQYKERGNDWSNIMSTTYYKLTSTDFECFHRSVREKGWHTPPPHAIQDSVDARFANYSELLGKFLSSDRDSPVIAFAQCMWAGKHTGKVTLDFFVNAAKSGLVDFIFIGIIKLEKYFPAYDTKTLLKRAQFEGVEFLGFTAELANLHIQQGYIHQTCARGKNWSGIHSDTKEHHITLIFKCPARDERSKTSLSTLPSETTGTNIGKG